MRYQLNDSTVCSRGPTGALATSNYVCSGCRMSIEKTVPHGQGVESCVWQDEEERRCGGPDGLWESVHNNPWTMRPHDLGPSTVITVGEPVTTCFPLGPALCMGKPQRHVAQVKGRAVVGQRSVDA